MRLYNTLTRTEEEFAPSQDNLVRMYACGLTVYSRGHIGNFRTFVAVDVLRRTLRHLEHYKVRHVVNFTDVDDRTIAGSQKAGMPLREYTNQWIDAFLEDSRALGLEDVEERPRATDKENLESMAQLVRALEKNGHTYQSDGSVYFKIATLPQYGRLARLDHDGLKAGARVDSDNYDKDNARDFVLWKATQKPRNEAELGLRIRPRPSRAGTSSARRWRCGCSESRPSTSIAAASISSFLITKTRSPRAKARPTHSSRGSGCTSSTCSSTKRRCRSRSATSSTFPTSSRKGTGRRRSATCCSATHYRKQVKFSWDAMSQAEESLRRLADFVARLDRVTTAGAHPEIAAKVSAAEAQFKDGDGAGPEHGRRARRRYSSSSAC